MDENDMKINRLRQRFGRRKGRSPDFSAGCDYAMAFGPSPASRSATQFVVQFSKWHSFSHASF